MSTSLGPLARGLRCGTSRRRDLLPSSTSSCRSPGATSRGRWCCSGQVAALLRRHLPAGDPVAPYADLLDVPGLSGQVLRGYLGGSIDAVVRVGGRYLVVDHKTNRLGPVRRAADRLALPAQALDDAIRRAHYPLQALLYAVALHRYLRWRQPGYDPAVHLGGVPLPVPARDGAGGAGLRRLGLEAAGRRSSCRCPTCWRAGRVRALRGPGLLRGAERARRPGRGRRARRGRLSALGGRPTRRCCSRLALAVRGTRQGSVVLRLRRPRPRRPTTGRRVAVPGQAALPRVAARRDGSAAVRGRRAVARPVLAAGAGRRTGAAGPRARPSPSTRRGSARSWPGCGRGRAPDDQRLAAAVCVLSRTAVLVGGPGTGKTTTVARRAGRAAARRTATSAGRAGRADGQGGVAAAGGGARGWCAAGPDEQAWLGGLSATTLHRLLGMRRGTTRSWHDATQPAAARRRRGGRGVDGVARACSPGCSRRCGPGARLLLVGRPRPARVGGGGRGAGGPGGGLGARAGAAVARWPRSCRTTTRGRPSRTRPPRGCGPGSRG